MRWYWWLLLAVGAYGLLFGLPPKLTLRYWWQRHKGKA